jgi:hypothetical protein
LGLEAMVLGSGLLCCCHRGEKGCLAFLCVHKKLYVAAVGIPTWKQKIRREKMPDHGDPWFSRSACGTAVPAKWIALDMMRITFMGWADWCCGPGCVYGPPAYAYVMCGLVVTFSTKSDKLDFSMYERLLVSFMSTYCRGKVTTVVHSLLQ